MPIKKNSGTATAVQLRSQAEKKLKLDGAAEDVTRTSEDPLRLLHELQVHKIELEMQNEELRRAWDEREQMESQLGKYSDLYDFAPVGYFNLDRSGIIKAVNFTGAEYLKVERSSLIQRNLDTFLSRETQATFQSFLEMVFATESKVMCEVAIQTNKDAPRIVHVEAVVSESGAECRAVVVDITKRRIAEDALKTLNNVLEKRVFERTTELSSTIRTLEKVIAMREQAEERTRNLNRLYAVLSRTNHAIVHTKDQDTLFHNFCRIAVIDGSFKLAWIGLVNGESGELRIAASYGETGFLDDIRFKQNGDLATCCMTQNTLREGSHFICNDFLGSAITRSEHERARLHGICASAGIVLKLEGRVIGTLTLYTDIPDFFDRQQTKLLLVMGEDISFALENINRENRRLESERALRNEIMERLRVVEALRENEQLLVHQNRQAAMGEMISNIAHQWRQPLNILGLNIQHLLLMHDCEEITREVLDSNIGKSMRIIQHMSQTIDDFRNYFKPEKEKINFNVRESIANMLSLIKDNFKNEDITIEFISKSNPVVNGYRNEFAQVILNILNNARDALIEKKPPNPRIKITIDAEGGRSVVMISDNAGGIPEEIIGKIFDPYFTTKGPQNGTGVGLFMSKAIIEKSMNGSLTARNLANGAEFRIAV